jgi:hypothetical protein
MGWANDGAVMILFRVTGLIRCCRASYRHGDFFLRWQFGSIYRLGTQVKRRARVRVAEKFLNRLYAFSPTDQKGPKAVTEIVEAALPNDGSIAFPGARMYGGGQPRSQIRNIPQDGFRQRRKIP